MKSSSEPSVMLAKPAAGALVPVTGAAPCSPVPWQPASTSAAEDTSITAASLSHRFNLPIMWLPPRRHAAPRLGAGRAQMLEHQYPRSLGAALIEVDDVFGEHADTAARHVGPDAPGLERAMEAITQIPAVAVEIKRPRAQRVVCPAGDEARQLGLALEHFRRPHPVGPDRRAVEPGLAD